MFSYGEKERVWMNTDGMGGGSDVFGGCGGGGGGPRESLQGG